MSSARFAFFVHPLLPWHRRVMGVRRGHFPLALNQPAGIDAVGITARVTMPVVGGEAEAIIVSVPDLPARLVSEQQRALALETRALRIAEQAGAQAIGLGSALGVVAGRGQPLRERTPLPITTGDASTAWATARITAQLATTLSSPIGLLGFKGTVGDAVAHVLALEGHEVWVEASGRAAKRAESIGAIPVDRETLLRSCRLVVGASTTGPILAPTQLQPNTTLVDLALPPTLASGRLPPGCRVVAGETLLAPRALQAAFWGRVWLTMAAYGSGCVYACLAEPLAIALGGSAEWSQGRRLDPWAVREAGRALLALGYRPVVRSRFSP